MFAIKLTYLYRQEMQSELVSASVSMPDFSVWWEAAGPVVYVLVLLAAQMPVRLSQRAWKDRRSSPSWVSLLHETRYPCPPLGTSSSRCKPFPRLPQLFVRFDPPQSISCFILQLPQTSIHRPKWASLQIAFEEVLSHDWSPLAILFWRLGWD